MAGIMNRLVDRTTGDWKEEALWLAGEAHLRGYYFDNESLLNWATYGFHVEDRYTPHPEFFDRLAKQFTDSPLWPLAQWRRAECQRKALMYFWTSSNHTISNTEAQELLSVYNAVVATQGSVAWAWTQWRIGRVHYFRGQLCKGD